MVLSEGNGLFSISTAEHKSALPHATISLLALNAPGRIRFPHTLKKVACFLFPLTLCCLFPHNLHLSILFPHKGSILFPHKVFHIFSKTSIPPHQAFYFPTSSILFPHNILTPIDTYAIHNKCNVLVSNHSR